MGSFCKSPTPPPTPDPVAIANAQSASNIQTAQEQQRLNMINTTGPQGSVNYAADPSAPGGYRQTTTLSPAEQANYDLQHQAEAGALNTANTQLGRVNDALATPLTTDGLPQLSGGNYSNVPALQSNIGGLVSNVQGGQIQSGVAPSGSIQTGFNGGHPLQYGFDQGQQVQGQIGPQDLYGAYRNAADASYGQAQSRLDPQFAQSENALRTRLANQGLSQNDTAYSTALQNFQQGKNDAYNQANFSAQNQGLNAENTLFGQSAAQGQFANSAAAQEYAQNQGQAGFHNATAGQDYTQNLGAANFANTAQQQQFGQNATAMQLANAAQSQGFDQSAQNAQLNNANAITQAQFGNSANLQAFNEAQSQAQSGNQARQQGLSERAYLQNEPINQFTGLLGLGQVGMPQGISYTPSQVANTDVLGANALAAQAAQANYNTRAQQQAGQMSGLFSLGSAAIMASDGRLKTDKRLLRVRPDGVEVWAFRYLTDPEGMVRVGVMAQQIRKLRPELVVRRRDGFLAVDYSALDLEAA